MVTFASEIEYSLPEFSLGSLLTKLIRCALKIFVPAASVSGTSTNTESESDRSCACAVRTPKTTVKIAITASQPEDLRKCGAEIISTEL